MTTRETWYVLEDGSFADPREVAPDAGGVLRHKSGAAVALGPHGPRSSGVDVEADDVVADLGQAGRGDEPDVADPEDADVHVVAVSTSGREAALPRNGRRKKGARKRPCTGSLGAPSRQRTTPSDDFLPSL